MKLTPEQYQEISMDPRYMNIGGLPSNHKGYDWTELLIRPFEIPELKLISRAATLGEPEHIIRAIDLTISRDVRTLTVGDYYYVLMWQKMHSYTKTPLIVEWPCPMNVWHRLRDGRVTLEPPTQEEVEESLQEGKEEADRFNFIPCNTLNTQPIQMPDVKIVSLDDAFVLPEGLDFPRVGTMLEVDALMKDPDMAFLVPALQWMPGETMKDKMDHFEQSNDLDLFKRANKANSEIVHGIIQTTTLTCRKCGSQHPYEIRLDPLSFFQ